MINVLWFLCFFVVLVHCHELELNEVQLPRDMAESLSKYLDRRNVNITDKCSEELNEYSKALKRGKFWALKMFDSSSRLPGGILSGHIGDFGAFDQCLNIKGNSTLGTTIFGKYCLGVRLFKFGKNTVLEANALFDFKRLGIPVPDVDLNRITAPLLWAVCTPSSCSAKEIRQFYSENGKNLLLFDYLCQDNSSEPSLDSGGLATIIFLGVILGIMAISTAYDLLIYFLNKKPAHNLLTSFSVFTNGRKLFEINNDPNQLSCLHGIRAITMTWVIVGHKFAMHSGVPVVNWMDYLKWYGMQSSQYIKGAYLAVDTFLLLSGLLIGYVYIISVEKGTNFNIVKYYVHRYLRVTPALGAVMLIHITLIDRLVTSPTWPGVAYVLSQPCKDDWWTALLYIQNYYSSSAAFMCNGPTWYLSVDMQLYLISPFILIALKKKPKLALSALGLLTFCSILSALLSIWFLEIRRDFVGQIGTDGTANYNQYYYYPTHTRAAPWFMGILLGYIIYKTKKTNIDTKIKKYQLHVLILGLWGLALAVLATCVFGEYDDFAAEYNKVGSTLYLSLSPSAWALAVSWVIFACVHGYGGPVNWFLSLPIFQFVSKLSYSMYLLHYLILFMNTYQDKTFNIYFSTLNLLYGFWADFMFTIFASIVLTLAFESPIISIEKVVFGKPKPDASIKRKSQEITTSVVKENDEQP